MHHTPHAPGPWHRKRGGPANTPEFTVCDFNGNPIATVHNPATKDLVKQFEATCNLIENAPRLLAAVTEYALQQDMQNSGITLELAELIKQCGGKDLHSRVIDHAVANQKDNQDDHSTSNQNTDPNG